MSISLIYLKSYSIGMGKKNEKDHIAENEKYSSLVKGEIHPIVIKGTIAEALVDEELLRTTMYHWYIEFSEFLGKDIMSPRLSHEQRQEFFSSTRSVLTGSSENAPWTVRYRGFCSTVTCYK